MSTTIVVPALGESVVEATVSKWFKKEGEPVEAGETLVELETDKVNLEVGAEKAGVLSKIEKQSGEDVKIGDVLGVIEEGSQKTAPAEQKPAASTPPPAEQQKQAAPEPPQKKEAPAASAARNRVKATPSARKMALEKGINLDQVNATGPGASITVEDIQAYQKPSKKPEPTPQQQPEQAPREAPRSPAAGAPTDREERIRMSRRRRTIAQRLVEAQRTAAMLTTYNEVDMTEIMELRKRHKETFKQKYGVNLGIVSFFVKGAIGALREFPMLNAELQGDEIVLKHYYDIGIAVGASEGLVVPVLRDADRLSFAEIERKIKEFVEKSENGTLSLEDLRGGTFTITNGGVFGSLLSTPILNPPQVAILGLHKIEDRPVVRNGQITVRSMMYVALSYDHRLVDGRESVQFLARIKQYIEDPAALMLEL